MDLIKLTKCSYENALKIKTILDKNCIETFNIKKKSSKQISSNVVIKVKKHNYLYAKLLIEKFLKQEELSYFEPILNVERLKKMHHLINTQTTDTPTLFASKLGISQRQLIVCLKHLKNLNAKKLNYKFLIVYFN